MATTLSISTKELQRVAAAAYEGQTLYVMLCNVGATGYNAESSVANWQTVEVSGGGYSRFSTTIGTGSYSGSSGSYKMPNINAPFTGASGGFVFDTIVMYVGTSTYPHSIITENPSVALSTGQTQTYRIVLIQDD